MDESIGGILTHSSSIFELIGDDKCGNLLEDKNIPQTLCEFHSNSPNEDKKGPKCSLEHPGMDLTTLQRTLA